MRLHVHEWGNADAPTVVCVHGVSGHGRRFRRLAEERLAARFHVLAPDLRGHGRSGWEPPWDIDTHLDDVLETFGDTGPSPWVGHSFGGRLVLELAARQAGARPLRGAARPGDRHPAARRLRLRPGRRDRPRLRLRGRGDRRAPDERLPDRRARRSRKRRASTSIETRDGRLHWRYARAAVATMYSELCRKPPPPTSLAGIPTLLVHAEHFGLVREEQLRRVPGGARRRPRARRSPGRPRRLLGRLRRDRGRGREVPDSSQSRFTRVNRSSLG